MPRRPISVYIGEEFIEERCHRSAGNSDDEAAFLGDRQFRNLLDVRTDLRADFVRIGEELDLNRGFEGLAIWDMEIDLELPCLKCVRDEESIAYFFSTGFFIFIFIFF